MATQILARDSNLNLNGEKESDMCDLCVSCADNPFSCHGQQGGSTKEIYRDEVPDRLRVQGNDLWAFSACSALQMMALSLWSSHKQVNESCKSAQT